MKGATGPPSSCKIELIAGGVMSRAGGKIGDGEAEGGLGEATTSLQVNFSKGNSEEGEGGGLEKLPEVAVRIMMMPFKRRKRQGGVTQLREAFQRWGRETKKSDSMAGMRACRAEERVMEKVKPVRRARESAGK